MPSVAKLLFFAVILAAAALELFFDVYRIAYFKAVSYDDYAPYLLYVIGDPEGSPPPSPFVYRIGSVLLAVPFYFLPLVPLDGGAAGDFITRNMAMARATQAVAAANVFYVALTAGVVFGYLTRRLRVSVEWAFIGAAATLFLGNHFALDSNDGIASFPLIVMLLLAVERRTPALLVALAIGTLVNEKAPLVAFLIFAARSAFGTGDRRGDLVAAGASAAALVLYVGFITAFPFSGGNPHQRDISTYAPAAVAMLGKLVDMKGVYRNLWPVLIIVLLWALGRIGPPGARFTERADVAAIFGLLAACLALDVAYNVGRIMMYVMPFLMIGAIQGLASARKDA